MGLSHSPKIITDGLIAYWDAANPKSYTGDTSIWYDLSGNNHHAYGDPGAEGSGYDDARFPTWDSNFSGQFLFNTSGMTVLTDLGNHSEITTDFWVKKTDLNSTYLWDARTTGTAYVLTNYTSNTLNVTSNLLKVNDPVTYDANSPWWNRWTNIILTSNSSESAIWIDGVNINDSRLIASSSFDENLGQYFRIGVRISGVVDFGGYISNIKIYNRVLTDSEIQNNFNSLRGRFGL